MNETDQSAAAASRSPHHSRRSALYQDILTNNRQIIDFDPSGNGKIAELIGTIGPNTTNVGVLVPGTYTNMADFNDYAKDAASFVNADPNGHLAMVAWADGGFPQTVGPGSSRSRATPRRSAPDLATFSHQLRDQINQQAGPDNNVQVTYAGPQLRRRRGGPGRTGRPGRQPNAVRRVRRHGPRVWSPSDLHDAQPDVQRYAMTAPGDPISAIQGVQVFGMGHGADPNTFPGVTDLATGNYPNGQPITGLAAHNGVFTTGLRRLAEHVRGVHRAARSRRLRPKPAPLTPDPMFLGP